MASPQQTFPHLNAPEQVLARWTQSPGRAVLAVLFVAILLAWLILMANAARQAGFAQPGLQPALLGRLDALPVPDWLATITGFCLGGQPRQTGLEGFAALTAMWFLMAVAMMLPSALPMVRTYCEIADTAKAKAAAVVSPFVLVAGYLATWLAASLVFAALTSMLKALLPDGPISAPMAGVLAVAGLYQFSRLKQACLEKCRNPFGVIFARWSDRAGAIFWLGLEQGLWCLGCCWALMMVMFAVGLMNVLWMALLGVLTIVEKQVASRVPGRLAGSILLVWSAALLVMSL